MTVKRFVSRFFRKDEPDNRIRAMWEREPVPRRRDVYDVLLRISFVASAVIALLILRTVL